MPLTPLLAAIHLALATVSSVQDAEPAPAPEKVMNGADEAVVWFVSKKPRVKIETHRGFTFHLDFATHGALSLAHVCANLDTEPKGLTLSLDPSNGVLLVDYDKVAKELRVLMRSSGTPVCKVPLPLADTTTRVLLRQREQLVLYAIPPDGSQIMPVWQGTVGINLVFRNAGQYELCTNPKIAMGKREFTYEEFRKGIKMDATDEIEDVLVSGVSPSGETFRHRYTFDAADVEKRTQDAYATFLKAAGNEAAPGGEPEAGATASPVKTE